MDIDLFMQDIQKVTSETMTFSNLQWRDLGVAALRFKTSLGDVMIFSGARGAAVFPRPVEYLKHWYLSNYDFLLDFKASLTSYLTGIDTFMYKLVGINVTLQ